MKMKQLRFRIGVALLTFTVGIAIVLVWVGRRYSLPVTILRPSTGKVLFVSAKGGLPCLVSERDVASARELLASGVEVDSTADDCITMEPSPRGVTLLMQASWRGDKEMVKLLLENGTNVNASDSWGSTPLSCAVRGKHLEIISLLLEKDAKIDARADIGRTPLMDVAGDGDLGVIGYLLDKGADVNARDDNGTTALMFASGFKQRQAASLLLKRGADPDLKDRDGRTAAVYAKQGFPTRYRIGRE
jgi:hypothetical protein